jgi:hypothetical protein
MSASSVRENARLAVEQDPKRLALESADRDALAQLLKAVRLAPTLEVCEALCRGERVPISRLDPEWVKAYGCP